MQDIPSVEQLMEPMEFDGDDLIANRNGNLGENQRYRLASLQNRAMAIGLAGFFGFALLATTFFYFGQANQNIILTLVGIFITFLNAIYVGMFARQWMRLNSDLRAGVVEKLSGQLERVVRADGQMNNFVLRMNGNSFYVKKELFRLFRHEVAYDLYRAPHSNILLAAEPAP